jgi:steroid delta-isomerase-like uncharacterized protein
MNPAELTEIATRWISLWTVPVDWALFDRLHAEAFVDEASGGRPSTRAGFAAGIAALVRAFPDLTTRVEDLVIDVAAGKVAVRWRAEGTNRERYLGTGPTHQHTVITGIEIIEIVDHRIVRRWGEWDVSAHLGWTEPGS